jgi:hypothetical protein
MLILNYFLKQLTQIANPTKFSLDQFSSMPKRTQIPWPRALPPLSKKEINLLVITFPIPFWSVFLVGFILYKWGQKIWDKTLR